MAKQIIMLIMAIVANALANVLVKLGATSLGSEKKLSAFIVSSLKNVYIWSGLVCFGLAFVFYTIVLTRNKLSVAYPVMTSVGFIIVSLFSHFLFREDFSVMKIVGVAIIAVGIWIVSTM